MANSYRVYDAAKCMVTFGGMVITGLGEDMVTGEKDEEFFSTSVGAQGDVVMSEINNPLGTVTITVQATSPQLLALYEAASNGTIAALWVTNTTTGEMFGGSRARIKNLPSSEHSQEAADREFEFQVFDYQVTNSSTYANNMPTGTTVSGSATAGTWSKSSS